MAKKPNFGFEKRQKDLKKQQKREEKAAKKRQKDEQPEVVAVLPEIDAVQRARLAALCADGWAIYERFSNRERPDDFHPFVAADYESVLAALEPHRAAGLKFLEWGSATGVITIMADMLGFEAFGIELDSDLIRTARTLAEKFHSDARFVEASFLPAGYLWQPTGGDGRVGTIGAGHSGYLELGHSLDEFDVVFAFPWGGEEPMMLDLMKTYGRAGRGAFAQHRERRRQDVSGGRADCRHGATAVPIVVSAPAVT